jgi:hypothetical protein
MGRWSELVDLHLPLYHTNSIWLLAVVHSDMEFATYEFASRCGAGGQPKLDLIGTHMRLLRRTFERRWSEPVDLRLALMHTNYIWSLAGVHADMECATLELAAQCGGCGQPKSDLLGTHMRLLRPSHERRLSELDDLPLLLYQTNVIWSLAVVHADVYSATHDMVAQSGVGCPPKLHLMGTHTRL